MGDTHTACDSLVRANLLFQKLKKKIDAREIITQEDRCMIDECLLGLNREQVKNLYSAFYDAVNVYVTNDITEDELRASLSDISRTYDLPIQYWIPCDRTGRRIFLYSIIQRGEFFDHMSDAFDMDNEDCAKKWESHRNDMEAHKELHMREWKSIDTHRLYKIEQKRKNRCSYERHMREGIDLNVASDAFVHVQILSLSLFTLSTKPPTFWLPLQFLHLTEDVVRSVVHKISILQSEYGACNIPNGIQDLIAHSTDRFEIGAQDTNTDTGLNNDCAQIDEDAKLEEVSDSSDASAGAIVGRQLDVCMDEDIHVRMRESARIPPRTLAPEHHTKLPRKKRYIWSLFKRLSKRRMRTYPVFTRF